MSHICLFYSLILRLLIQSSRLQFPLSAYRSQLWSDLLVWWLRRLVHILKITFRGPMSGANKYHHLELFKLMSFSLTELNQKLWNCCDFNLKHLSSKKHLATTIQDGGCHYVAFLKKLLSFLSYLTNHPQMSWECCELNFKHIFYEDMSLYDV